MGFLLLPFYCNCTPIAMGLKRRAPKTHTAHAFDVCGCVWFIWVFYTSWDNTHRQCAVPFPLFSAVWAESSTTKRRSHIYWIPHSDNYHLFFAQFYALVNIASMKITPGVGWECFFLVIFLHALRKLSPYRTQRIVEHYQLYNYM